VSAIISECGKYRYRLERKLWDAGSGQTTVIMVNPSTADAETNDATIRKLIGFGSRWSHLVVGNLFAYRSTDVRQLAVVDDPIGPENDAHLEQMIKESFRLIFAWGPAGKLPQRLRGRWRVIDKMARTAGKQPLSIGPVAMDGHPKHPLMLPYNSELRDWIAP
jgi:hypothetical protein